MHLHPPSGTARTGKNETKQQDHSNSKGSALVPPTPFFVVQLKGQCTAFHIQDYARLGSADFTFNVWVCDPLLERSSDDQKLQEGLVLLERIGLRQPHISRLLAVSFLVTVNYHVISTFRRPSAVALSKEFSCTTSFLSGRRSDRLGGDETLC